MFDEPDENESPAERSFNPEDQAKERFDEFRMHAEIAAVFEATRKFEAEILPKLDPGIARDIQRTMAKLEKSRSPESPVLPPDSMADAARLLDLPKAKDLTTNDYHVHRRPAEVMIVRWLTGEQVEIFYERFQAHFDAALNQFRQEERQQKEWKQDPQTLKYLDALDKIDVKMPDRYLRELIRKHKLFVLSTQAADELDIIFLADYVMGANAADVVGTANAPGEERTEQDRAWFFKLFSLRGMKDAQERMCFFTFLQKAEESW
ncbi:MAG TPA: hypothetical protein VL282_05365 [Tepidisphaeraceae bacterium]|nr:hypothetical protein [Tepidisphaeraceae bacterium]